MRWTLLGIILVGLIYPRLPELPTPWWGLLCLPGAFYLQRRVRCLITGFVVMWVLCASHGASLLERRLPETCRGTPLEVTGTVNGIPSQRGNSHGRPSVRFELLVESVKPHRCETVARVVLYQYGEA